MTQALYRKWRPQSFDEVVGQEHVTLTLKNQIAGGRVGHAYLFVGSRGCGKTTTARILAKEINLRDLDPSDPRTGRLAEAIAEGRALDVIEFDAATHTQVDKIREIIDKVAFQPSELRYKVYIIDEAHMLSVSAFNALLKTLEEPPPHVVFILATTDPQKIPATVLSRCQRFNFKRVPARLIVSRLRHICQAEGIEADDHALMLIARHAAGAMRDAISLLDQLASSSSMHISADDVREALGATDATTVRTLVDGLAQRNPAIGLDAIQTAIDQGADARQLARQLVDYLRAILQAKLVSSASAKGRLAYPDWSEAEQAELSSYAERLEAGLLLRGIRAFSSALGDMRGLIDPQLALEMAFLECVADSEQAPAPGKAANTERTPAIQHIAPSPASPERPSARPVQQESAQTRSPDQPAPREPAAQPPSSRSAGEPDLETLRALWKQVIQEVNQLNKPAAALLRSCRPHSVEGDIVRIQAEHELFKTRLEDPKNKTAVLNVLNRLLNKKFSLVISSAQQAQSDPTDDPVVQAAQRLGGRVREG
ncbi:MAG: DNA polymerase III subunit gamma/tau [Anaerolineae bacterium]|nr:DNA polymerase III subunit gamma/tau [Thermoflexales bacterium]MDW8408656.1 DNA polymerase III subunit gamma/tau [Anaerolineae bacterium]